MRINKLFDLYRVISLLKQDILFNYKFYLSFIVGLSIGIYLFSYLMIRNLSGGFLSANFFLYNMLFGAILVFVGMSFPAFRDQKKTSFYLLVPGSAFEKLLVQLVIRFVFFIPLALLLLRLGIYLAVASMVPDPKTGFDPLFVADFSYAELFSWSAVTKNNPLRDLSYLFFAFAGAVYFKRFAVVKTVGAMLFLPGMLFLIVKITGGQINWAKIGTDYLNGNSFFLTLSPFFIGLLLCCLPWVYFKLKEKEL